MTYGPTTRDGQLLIGKDMGKFSQKSDNRSVLLLFDSLSDNSYQNLLVFRLVATLIIYV